MFANRLQKVQRHLAKWARREDVSCYRIYDADIPEFPLAVDRYEDYLHVAEYRRDHPLSPEEYTLWRAGCRQVLTEVSGIAPARIFFKTREPQKGKQQYEKQGQQQREAVVSENGLKFRVNFSDYLDTGLFLDHRPTRQMVRERAAGKRVLNLFAYTGAFTVYAAAGGAAATTTIDLSNTYLEWAQRNLAENGLAGPQHRFVRADVLEWLRQPPRERFDLVVLDPPTFSNSKNMREVLDIQRDHANLLEWTLAHTTPGGVIFFSTNFRRFKMDAERIRGASIRDISAQTIPPDFKNAKIHHCFEVVKTGAIV